MKVIGFNMKTSNHRMQTDFDAPGLTSAADAKLHGLPLLSSKDVVDFRH